MRFTSPDVSTDVAEVRIHAASVNSWEPHKNVTLKGEDSLYVNRNPLITFRSTKIVQGGSDTFVVDGDFTIRGVTRSEKLTLAVSDKETGAGKIKVHCTSIVRTTG